MARLGCEKFKACPDCSFPAAVLRSAFRTRVIPTHVQSPCRPEQCEPFYDTREDPSRRWRSLGKVFL